MKTASVREVRNNFASLEAWVEEGQKVEIRKRGKPIAWLVPIPHKAKKEFVTPDFAARRKALWKGRVFSDADVAAMRVAELEGEQG